MTTKKSEPGSKRSHALISPVSGDEIPEHLTDKQALGAFEGEPVAQFEIGDQANFVYLIIDWPNRRVAVIDPQEDIDPLMEVFDRYSLTIAGVLLTHSHFDHLAGIPRLVRQFPNLPVYLHEKEMHRISIPMKNQTRIQTVRDEDIVLIGGLRIRVLHTPGHSAGACCYLLDPPAHEVAYLFSGDTAFIGDCGRTDLETGDPKEMFASLRKLRTLGETYGKPVIVLPGHHYAPACASTLRTEAETNRAMLAKNVAELEALP